MKTVSKKLFSLMLVAILLVSALPFQAFAVPHDATHTASTSSNNNGTHDIICTDTTCDYYTAKTLSCTYDAMGKCTECGYQSHVSSHGLVYTSYSPSTHRITCSVTGCSYAANIAACTFDPITNKCTDCGQSKPVTHDSTHTTFAMVSDGAGNHVPTCKFPGCTYTGTPEKCTYFNYDASTHKCSVCGYLDPAGHSKVDVVPAVPATCTTDGKTASQKCTLCGCTWGSTTVHATGHDYDASGVCKNCGASKTVATYKVTFNAGTGHTFADGSTTKVVIVNDGDLVTPAQTPLDPKGEFKGWYSGGTPFDFSKKITANVTITAEWATVSYEVKFYCILNNQLSTAQFITSQNLAAGSNLADYVKTSGIPSHLLTIHPGYKLDYSSTDFPIKKYINGVFYPLANTDVVDGAWTVYINLTPDTYNLTLNPNGGTVNPAKISGIAYGTTIALPTPTKPKAVFQGWKDADGNIYNGTMAYKFDKDMTLIATWSDEAAVMLRVYTNGNTSSPDMLIELTSLVRDSKVYQGDVKSVIDARYSYSLPMRGLFDDSGWASFVGNPSKLGDAFVEIRKDNTTNYIYVMLYNATRYGGTGSGAASASVGGTGSTLTPIYTTGVGVTVPNNGNAYWVSTGPSTGYWVYTDGVYTPSGNSNAYWVATGNGAGYWVYPVTVNPNTPTITYTYVGTNPKTGDNSMIEVAAAVMVLAAAALVTMFSMRKKKMI